MFTSRRRDLAKVESEDVVSRDGTWYGGKSDNGIEGYAITIDDPGFPFSLSFVRRGRNCCTVRTDDIKRVLMVSTNSFGGNVRNGPTG